MVNGKKMKPLRLNKNRMRILIQTIGETTKKKIRYCTAYSIVRRTVDKMEEVTMKIGLMTIVASVVAIFFSCFVMGLILVELL